MARTTRVEIPITATDKASRTFKRVERNLKGFAATTRTVLGGLTGFGSIAGAAGLTMLAKRSVDLGSRLDDVSKKLGVTTDFLQEFGFAAREVGLRTESAEMGLQRFTRRVAEAQNGTGELLPVLQQYGISLRDATGRARSAEEVLLDYANAIKATADPQEQLRMAFKAFDSEGAGLVSILKDGAAGLGEYRKQAHMLGQVMDQNTVQALAKAENHIERFGNKFTIMIGESIEEWGKLIDYIKSKAAGLSDQIIVPNLQELMELPAQLEQAILGLTSEEQRFSLIDDLINRYSDLQDLLELNAASGNKIISEKQIAQVRTAMAELEAYTRAAEAAGGVVLSNQRTGAVLGETNVLLQEMSATAFSLGETFQAAFNPNPVVTFADTLNSWVPEGFENVQTSAETTKESISNSFFDMTQASQIFATGLENGLVNAAQNGKTAFGDMAQFILAELQRLLIRSMLFQAFTGLGFAGFAANFAPPPVGGARAGGGPVQGGRSYIVGERGPEMITMGGNGSVTPTHKLGGPTFNVDMRGASLEAVQRLEQFVMAMNGSIEQRATAAVQDRYSRAPSYMRR